MNHMMFSDFEFRDDDRLVMCTRGVRDAAAGAAIDDRWWYLTFAGRPPVRLVRVTPGETRGDVWHSALQHLDGLE